MSPCPATATRRHSASRRRPAYAAELRRHPARLERHHGRAGQRKVEGSTMSVVRMSDLDLSGKRVLIREDLNVPVADDGWVLLTGTVT